MQEYGECQEPEDSFCKDTRQRESVLSCPSIIIGNYEVTSYEGWGNYQKPIHGFYSILEEVTQISNFLETSII